MKKTVAEFCQYFVNTVLLLIDYL